MNKNLTAIPLILVILLTSGCNRATRQKADATPQNAEPAPAVTTVPSADANSVVNTPGRYDQTIQVGDATREFVVYVPELAGGSAQVPLVVMLHGTSGTGDEFYGRSGWREKADKEGFIVVFPTALVHCYHEDENFDGDFTDPSEREVSTKWEAGELGERLPLCTQDEIASLAVEKRALADHPVADDMAFFHSMFDFLGANYSIDSKRTYVTGFSNGARMAGRLSVEMSERVAAGAAHEAPLAVAGPSDRPISVIATYGNADDNLVGLNNGNPFPLEESLIQQPVIKSSLVDRWLAALQLADVYEFSEGTISGERYVQFLYTTSTIGADNLLKVIFIDNMTHEYPNGKNHPVIAANMLWEFFSQYQLP